jgi:outer membrane lipoprotein SlyB
MAFRITKLVLGAAALSVVLAGCARTIDSGTVEGSTVGEVNEAFFGTVQNVRAVQVQEGDRLQQNTTGAIVGGLAGAGVGALFGGGWGRVLATGAGAIVGAGAGAAAERQLSRQQGLEYTVRLDNGRMLTIVQGPENALQPGQRAIVQIGGSGRARVIPA